uniref:CAP-Gly domain-containing protein n=1 Tax=Parascaris univalens TaxID=6257 RepID=A0A914ZYX0_PARUN
MYASDNALLMKTHEGAPWKHVVFPAATRTVKPAISLSEERLQNKVLKTADADILTAASSCSTAPRPKQRRLSLRPAIFSHKREQHSGQFAATAHMREMDESDLDPSATSKVIL